MFHPGGWGARVVATCALMLALTASSCALLPSELNLSPVYRHRLDENGDVLEMDVLWPVFHYERTVAGGTDFRIRPFYRYITETEAENVVPAAATEHQFLWPLGRVRSDGRQTIVRLFPVLSHTARTNQDGERETDWYFAFPFIWGGSRQDGNENYFGIVPLYLDAPDFLTYERFRMILWPLYIGLEKQGRVQHIFPWPLGGYGYGEDGSYWHRLLPLYSVTRDPRWERNSLLWPFISWGREGLDTDNPISRFFFLPLFGIQGSEDRTVSGWTFMWPLFQKVAKEGLLFRLDFLWPIFRYMHDYGGVSRAIGSRTTLTGGPFRQWWLFPLVTRTESENHNTWGFLWPFIWLRHFSDPGSESTQQWVLPVFWHTNTRYNDGDEDDLVKVWPLFHRSQRWGADGAPTTGDWRFPSVFPWRRGNARGIQEFYSWAWTLAEGRQRGRDDVSMQLIANLYTTRTRNHKKLSSVPFLYNYEGDEDGGTLRLLQFIPIPWFGTSSEEDGG